MRHVVLTLVLFAFIGMHHHAGASTPASDARLPVSVSIPPQKYFVERIGGDLVEVNVMVPAGASAHTYEPRPAQMRQLARSRIYFAVGIEFEGPWLPRFQSSNPGMRIVHTDAGLEKIAGCGTCGVAHAPQQSLYGAKGSNAEPHHHGDGALDPHVWLSPRLVRQQARHIHAALREVDPANSATYTLNYTNFLREIAAVERRIREILPEPSMEVPHAFLVYHPAWGYFAQDFGLEQLTIEVDGKEPGPRTLRRQIELARERGIMTVFIQPQESTRAARTIAEELDVELAYIDPLAEHWADNLIRVAELIGGTPH